MYKGINMNRYIIKVVCATIAMGLCSSVFAEKNMKTYILTPPPSPKPRINGTRIFGCRPGNPFLFKIPATGKQPLYFSAKGLPLGLSIDAQTGIITGTVNKQGEYNVLITVKNKLGEDRRELRIRIGNEICLTPPMGWNSWYCHSELISEKAMRETAKAMVEKGLADHGWTYVNIDDCWQGVRGGTYHAIQPNDRFENMKGMCDYIHLLGLKVGIYSTPWMGTFAGFIGSSAPNKAGDYSAYFLPEEKRLQKYQFFGRYPGSIKKKLNHVGEWFFDKDAKQWAEWGFDYLKIDWKPNDIPTTKRIYNDLAKCKRDIVLSLSNAAPFKNSKELSKYANCWRTTGDIHAKWKSISKIGFGQQRWQPFTKSGHWNDPDMLQVGNIGTPNRKNKSFKPTRLTPDEQYTQISLWCLLSAPLLLSCDIASLDEFTLSLLTNDEVLEIDQDPAGLPAHRVAHDDTKEIWMKKLEDGNIAVGLFNLSNKKDKLNIYWTDLGLTGNYVVRDLWRQKNLGDYTHLFSTEVNPHGVVFIKITNK